MGSLENIKYQNFTINTAIGVCSVYRYEIVNSVGKKILAYERVPGLVVTFSLAMKM